jgi:hypothetical protein|eukprot:scaffold261_cov318-Chaetoceros_neogracile.AAC.17
MALKALMGINSSERLKNALQQIIKEAKQQESSNTNENNDRKIQELELILKETESCVPLRAIAISKSIASKGSQALGNLNDALRNGTLQYTKPQEKKITQAYQSRIQKLQLAEQERKYSKITKNLDTSPADDQTIKSMTYAASVGMNMIVAPISIGVIMYFFAGKLFAFMVPGYEQEDGKINIIGVIAGVIAGVIMLFIEMILFVIRNHEMDKYVTKKMKRQKNPFGYDKKRAERTFVG